MHLWCPIDFELGDMTSTTTAAESRMFRYWRLNPDLPVDGLKGLCLNHIEPRDVVKIDAVQFVDKLCEVGSTYARLALSDIGFSFA